jgi:hypothetical protein
MYRGRETHSLKIKYVFVTIPIHTSVPRLKASQTAQFYLGTKRATFLNFKIISQNAVESTSKEEKRK